MLGGWKLGGAMPLKMHLDRILYLRKPYFSQGFSGGIGYKGYLFNQNEVVVAKLGVGWINCGCRMDQFFRAVNI